MQTGRLRLSWNSQQDLALALAESVCPDAWLGLLAESLCPDEALSCLLHKAAVVGHKHASVKYNKTNKVHCSCAYGKHD